MKELKNGIWSRFYFDSDLVLVKNVYEYFNIQTLRLPIDYFTFI